MTDSVKANRRLILLAFLGGWMPALLADDGFYPERHFPLAPEVEARYHKEYKDILTPYGAPRQHPDALHKSVEEINKEWDESGMEAKQKLLKAAGQPAPAKRLTRVQAIRYLNEQLKKQKLPYRVWLMPLPLRGEEDMEDYYRHLLGGGVNLSGPFRIEHPIDSLWTMLLTLAESLNCSFLVYGNGDIVITHRMGSRE